MAAGNGSFAGISAQVLGFNKLAEQGLFAAKIKAAVAAAVMLATAACGAAEFVAKVRPLGLHFDLSGQMKSIFEPILRTLRQPFHIPVADSKQTNPKAPVIVQTVPAPESHPMLVLNAPRAENSLSIQTNVASVSATT